MHDLLVALTLKRNQSLLIWAFAVCAMITLGVAGVMAWQKHASLPLISVIVEPLEPEILIIPVPEDAREETTRRFFAECRGETASRSFNQYIWHKLRNGRDSDHEPVIQCPVEAGHVAVRLAPGLYVFRTVEGKGFEDLRLVNVEGDKTLDFSNSVFMLSATRIY